MEQDAQSGVVGRLAEVRGRIELACQDAGRATGDVQLIAVSKTFEAEHIAPVIAAGQRLFGENRVQEAKGKWPTLREGRPDIELHLIGPLQSNKVREALALFDVIQTLDRESLAKELAKEIARGVAEGGRPAPRLLVQVNTGEEPQKAGVTPAELPELLRLCRDELKLDIAGLMCIPPVEEEPAIHFAFLAKLAAEQGLKGLSMGMSDDYETAVAFGATYVRVGSAIFGHRPKL